MSRRRSRWRGGAAACCLSLLQASAALAFSDPTSFGVSPIVAGGGGRYFTGSPADGYTCKACHSGADAPKASVLGLPLAGYKPGSRYEVTVKWPDDAEKISLALELTDGKGAAAGSLRLPPDGEILDPEFCEPASDAILAAQLTETGSGRQIINVPDCGSKRVRFLWTAPSSDIGTVWFAGSMVASDGEGDPYHDGVTDFGRVIGSPATASNTTAECSVSAGAVGGSGRRAVVAGGGVLAALAISARGWRRRRRRGRRPAGACAG